MANKDHVDLLKGSVFGTELESEWNVWRRTNPEVRPDLAGEFFVEDDLTSADLHGADLRGASFKAARLTDVDFSFADLREASLADANLSYADFHKADLREADLSGAYLSHASLGGADLRRASLGWANISGADFTGADLGEADLTITNAIEANFSDANLTGCHVYGISAWGLKLKGATQQNLVITIENEPQITVDNIEVAQFVYLLLHNQKIRDAIDTITSKAVLILGRFTPPDRKAVLEAIRDALRERGYVPILFDFTPSENRDLTETIQLLANMAKFVVADLTDAKSIPQELSHIVPNLPSVPIQPILLASQREYAMFEHWRRFPWVLNEFLYEDQAYLINHLDERVITPVESRLQSISPGDALRAARREIEELRRQLAG